MKKTRNSIAAVYLFTCSMMSYATSFDCTKASTAIEKSICGNPSLGVLDDQLAATYHKAYNDSSAKDELKIQQREWVKNIRNKCTNDDCLSSAYASRIADLNQTKPLQTANEQPAIAEGVGSNVESAKKDITSQKVQTTPVETDNQQVNENKLSVDFCSKLKSSTELKEYAGYAKQLANNGLSYSFDTKDKIVSKWLVGTLKPFLDSYDNLEHIHSDTLAVNECALSIRDTDLLYLMASNQGDYEALKEELNNVAKQVNQTIRKVDASGKIVSEIEKKDNGKNRYIIGDYSGDSTVDKEVSRNNNFTPLWIPSWLLILNGGEQVLKNAYPEIKADALKVLADMEAETKDRSNDNLSTDLIAKFKSEWCKNIDNESKGLFTYKNLATGDLCLAPEIVISNILKLKNTNTENTLDAFNNINQSQAFLFDHALSDLISNEDYHFIAASFLVFPNIKKIYLSSFTIGVCPEDPTNSLNEDNSFRKALETKYGKTDGSISEYDARNQELNQLKSSQKEQGKQAITVKEAVKARDYGDGLKVVDSLTSNIPKDLINTIFWNKDEQLALSVASMSSEGFGHRLSGCNSTNFFYFGYLPSIKLVTLITKEEKAQIETQQKYQKNANTPKF